MTDARKWLAPHRILNDARAVEWDASECRTARSSALGIIIVVCGPLALVSFAALWLVP